MSNEVAWPSDRKVLLVEVFHLTGGEEPYICGIHGWVCSTDIEKIERDLEGRNFDKGAGCYLYEARWDEVEEYWVLDEVGFRPEPEEVADAADA
jgi:hypothetical protein